MPKKTFEVSDSTEVVEFTVPGNPDSTFKAVSAAQLPAVALIRYAELVNAGDLWRAHKLFFEDVLEPDSYLAWDERLNSKDNPITMTTMVKIASWLVGEVYGGVV